MSLLLMLRPLAPDASSSSTTTGATSLTWSHTVGTGQVNGLLVVGVSLLNALGQTVSGVTYNGIALTTEPDAARSNGTGGRVEVWYLIAPASGAHNIVVTFSASVAAVGGGQSWSGANQTDPFGEPVTATGVGTAISVTVASSAGRFIQNVVASASTSLTVGAGQTQEWNSGITGLVGAGSNAPGAASVAMTWTAAVSALWASSGVPIQPAGGVLSALNITGTITGAGALTKIILKLLIGSGTPVGNLIKTVTKLLSGVSTPAGSTKINKISFLAVSGATALSGVLTRTASKLFSGALSVVGVLNKTTSKQPTGSTTPVGVTTKNITKNQVGNVTPGGAVTKTTTKSFTGSAALSGVLIRTTKKILAGLTTPSGTLKSPFTLLVSGVITPASTLIRSVSKNLSGALTPSGSVVKTVYRFFAGVINPSGGGFIGRKVEVLSPTRAVGLDGSSKVGPISTSFQTPAKVGGVDGSTSVIGSQGKSSVK